MEQDDREGIVRNYLDMLLPDNWDSMDYYRRREYIRDIDDPTRPTGTVKRHVPRVKDFFVHLSAETAKMQSQQGFSLWTGSADKCWTGQLLKGESGNDQKRKTLYE